jgi:hypothetical protein
MANWGGITSDAAQPATYGDTTGFNNANSGWWDRNFGTFSSKDLVSALQAAGKATNAQADKDPGFMATTAAPAGSPMRRVPIDQLAQLLNKQRDALYNSALTPGTKAEPVIPNRTIGLLGF